MLIKDNEIADISTPTGDMRAHIFRDALPQRGRQFQRASTNLRPSMDAPHLDGYTNILEYFCC